MSKRSPKTNPLKVNLKYQSIHELISAIRGPRISDVQAKEHLRWCDVIEDKYSFQFPTGYREYISTFGQGLLAHGLVIYVPHTLDDRFSIAEWRGRWKNRWFWNENSEISHDVVVRHGVIIGSTIDGDLIALLSHNVNFVCILPRHSSKFIIIPSYDFNYLVQWILFSGVLVQPVTDLVFIAPSTT